MSHGDMIKGGISDPLYIILILALSDQIGLV